MRLVSSNPPPRIAAAAAVPIDTLVAVLICGYLHMVVCLPLIIDSSLNICHIQKMVCIFFLVHDTFVILKQDRRQQGGMIIGASKLTSCQWPLLQS